ncbi:ABC transporter permease [Solirhodobacter olei]|uniref:ABC transporter permease n=1 Tax=Solirhodobacter olei TaxID=2493082 RepID=UPI000FD91020|nr:ABC transporter permease [Solirhodobacter olei]
MRSLGPVLTVLVAILAIWYVGAVLMNARWAEDQAQRAHKTLTTSELVIQTMEQKRPVLPAPHQVAVALWQGVFAVSPTSKRSLVYHGWVTLSATLLGFVFGTAAGVLLAVGMVYNRAMDMSVMPWAIASQTIPIVAIAPMIIVVLYSIGITGLIPKAIISAYLSFFPVVVGMVKGLRSPDAMQIDLLKTYNAGGVQTFWKLRMPSSMPYFFTSLKVAAAAALVGTIVGELPTGAVAGLGARLLSGSYYGQTIQIWAVLVVAAVLAAGLVMVIGGVQSVTLKRMGMER